MTLNPGDIAIVGYITNGSPDSFSFVNLVSISAGEVIYFTDNGWTGTGFRGSTSTDGDGNENLIRFTANAAIAAGTVIRSIDTSANFTWTKSGTIGSTTSGGYNDLSLSGSGEQIAAFQSTNPGNPLNSGFTAIAQIDNTGAFENATGTNDGNVIPGLSQAANTAVLFNDIINTYAAFKFNTLASGTPAQWLAAINNAVNWTFNTTSTALPPGNITVTSGSPTVNLSVSSNTGTEAAASAITVTATASGAVTGSQTVTLGVAGTGITAGDYTLTNSTITIPNGQTVGTVTFTIINDTLAEGTETATLTISNPSSGITLGTATQNVDIIDDDASSLTLSVTPTSFSEAAGATAATGTVTRTGSTTAALAVNLASNDLTEATVPATVTIPVGQASATFAVAAVDDTILDGSQTVTLTASATGLTNGTATVTVTDNETPPASSAALTNSIVLPGNSTDLFPLNGGSNAANVNRLGGFGSDYFYDARQNVYYGLVDRGPGGGVIPYQTRVQQFSLDVDKTTGAISNFKLLKTIPFTVPAGTTLNGVTSSTQTAFDGLNPRLLNKDASVLGLSLDPEGFTVAPNGNFYLSDEYGPSIYEFSPTGSFIRAFVTPANLISKAGTTNNYVDGRPTITSGRQDNRGFEGVTTSPDGSKLYALLQDSLVNEGSNNDGRNSPNIRLVEFDTATGNSTAQYIYQLESLTTINDRIPGTTNDFSATAQGRNIGISAITALNNKEFLVLERDNRGLGVDPTASGLPVASKRLYKIDLTGATNVSGVSLANTNTLPTGVTPVSKSLFLDIAASLSGQKIPEKIEGVTIGPQLADGSYALIVGTDNDFSVTQNDTNTQFDVVTDGNTFQNIPLGSTPPAGFSLIPNFIYSFKTQPNAIALTRPTNPTTPPTTTSTPSPDATLTQNANKIFQIGGSTGTAQLKFSKVSGDAKSVNEIGAFLVDDDAGKIGSLSPGQAGYVDAALKRAKVVFSSLPSGDFESGNNTSQLTFSTGSRLGFYLVANGTTDTARLTSNPGNILFGFPSGNGGSQEYLRVSQTGTDPFNLSWEDSLGGGDKDYNDIVLNVQVTKDAAPIGARQQGDAEIIDLTDYAGRKLAADVVVTGSAAYNDFVGLYKIDDATGKVGNLKPGDAGYAKAALERAVVEYGNRNTRVLGQLDGGGLLAPFIVANASREQLLSQNPNNDSGSNPNAYFSFLGANPDGVDHIRLLGNNTFGFEDLKGGGDKDFNDAVFQVNNLRLA